MDEWWGNPPTHPTPLKNLDPGFDVYWNWARGDGVVIASCFLCQRMHTHIHTHTNTSVSNFSGWRMALWGMVVKIQYTTHTYYTQRERERESERDSQSSGRQGGKIGRDRVSEMGGDLSEIDNRHRHSQFIYLPFLIYFLLLKPFYQFIPSHVYIICLSIFITR